MKKCLLEQEIPVLQSTFSRLSYAIEEIEYCYCSLVEERDELIATNEMLKGTAEALKKKKVVNRVRNKSMQWNDTMQEILNDKPDKRSKLQKVWSSRKERKSRSLHEFSPILALTTDIKYI